MKLLDVRDLADRLNVSTDWVYTQVEAGAIPHIRLPGTNGRKGRLIRFTEDHVRAILAAGEQPAEPSANTPPHAVGRPTVRPTVHLAKARRAAHERRAAELARRTA